MATNLHRLHSTGNPSLRSWRTVTPSEAVTGLGTRVVAVHAGIAGNADHSIH